MRNTALTECQLCVPSKPTMPSSGSFLEVESFRLWGRLCLANLTLCLLAWSTVCSSPGQSTAAVSSLPGSLPWRLPLVGCPVLQGCICSEPPTHTHTFPFPSTSPWVYAHLPHQIPWGRNMSFSFLLPGRLPRKDPSGSDGMREGYILPSPHPSFDFLLLNDPHYSTGLHCFLQILVQKGERNYPD